MFAFGCWAGIKMFLHEKGACQNDMKTVSLQFYGLAPYTAPLPDFATAVWTAPCTAPLPDFATAVWTAPCTAPLPDFATAVWTAPCTAPWPESGSKVRHRRPHLWEVRTPIACQLSGEKRWNLLQRKIIINHWPIIWETYAESIRWIWWNKFCSASHRACAHSWSYQPQISNALLCLIGGWVPFYSSSNQIVSSFHYYWGVLVSSNQLGLVMLSRQEDESSERIIPSVGESCCAISGKMKASAFRRILIWLDLIDDLKSIFLFPCTCRSACANAGVKNDADGASEHWILEVTSSGFEVRKGL